MSQTQPSSPVTPRRFNWRRLFQFRLRTILILTTIIAVWLGWWSYKARQQREAVAVIRKTGGEVEYDASLPWTVGMKDPPQWPQWLLENIGVDYFGSVQAAFLINTEVTDADLEHLKGLTALQGLGISNTKVTDAGLEHLKGLTALQKLTVSNTKVTDAGLEHLEGLTDLRWLLLDNTQVTDAGVARLQEALPNCWCAHSQHLGR